MDSKAPAITTMLAATSRRTVQLARGLATQSAQPSGQRLWGLAGGATLAAGLYAGLSTEPSFNAAKPTLKDRLGACIFPHQRQKSLTCSVYYSPESINARIAKLEGMLAADGEVSWIFARRWGCS